MQRIWTLTITDKATDSPKIENQTVTILTINIVILEVGNDCGASTGKLHYFGTISVAGPKNRKIN